MQFSTIFKDTRKLADAGRHRRPQSFLAGEEPEANDTETYDNGVKVVPSYLLESDIVYKDNIQTLLIDSGYWTEDEVASRPGLTRTVLTCGRPAPRGAGRPGSPPAGVPTAAPCTTKDGGSPMANPILEMRAITKTFPGVKALQDVSTCRSSAARSTRSAVRTAPASRR